MAKPKILITSAGGKTGIPTTLQLLDMGFPVRAFVRESAAWRLNHDPDAGFAPDRPDTGDNPVSLIA